MVAARSLLRLGLRSLKAGEAGLERAHAAMGDVEIVRHGRGITGDDPTAMLDGPLNQMSLASGRLIRLSRIVRYMTKHTPAGESLDLDASAGPI